MITIQERIAALRHGERRRLMEAVSRHVNTACDLSAAVEGSEGLSDLLAVGYPAALPDFDQHVTDLCAWRDAILAACEARDAADPLISVEIECSCTLHAPGRPGFMRRETVPLSEVPEIWRTCTLNALSVPPGRVTRVEVVK